MQRSPHHRPHSSRCRFTPTLDVLEDRTVPAITVTQAVGSNLIVITGDNASDLVQVTDNGTNAAGAISVTGTGLAVPFNSLVVPVNQTIQVVINTSDGDDTVFYRFTGDLLLANTAGRGIQSRTGAGRDVFRLNASQSIDIAANVQLNLFVNGQADADRISARYHGISLGNVSFVLLGGPGVVNDRVFAQMVFDAGSSGTAFGQVMGQGGDDLVGLTIDRFNTDAGLNVSGLLNGGPGFNSGVATDNITVQLVQDLLIL